MILSQQSILEEKPIYNMVDRNKYCGVSYGVSSAGYDVRIAQDVLLWPGRFVLASTIEKFCMPDDLIGIVHDKSTWARRGVAVQNTVIEPGWSGYLTLELTMHAFKFLRIKQGVGIAQIIFHKLDKPTTSPYNGKYQNQANRPVNAILES